MGDLRPYAIEQHHLESARLPLDTMISKPSKRKHEVALVGLPHVSATAMTLLTMTALSNQAKEQPRKVYQEPPVSSLSQLPQHVIQRIYRILLGQLFTGHDSTMDAAPISLALTNSKFFSTFKVVLNQFGVQYWDKIKRFHVDQSNLVRIIYGLRYLTTLNHSTVGHYTKNQCNIVDIVNVLASSKCCIRNLFLSWPIDQSNSTLLLSYLSSFSSLTHLNIRFPSSQFLNHLRLLSRSTLRNIKYLALSYLSRDQLPLLLSYFSSAQSSSHLQSISISVEHIHPNYYQYQQYQSGEFIPSVNVNVNTHVKNSTYQTASLYLKGIVCYVLSRPNFKSIDIRVDELELKYADSMHRNRIDSYPCIVDHDHHHFVNTKALLRNSGCDIKCCKYLCSKFSFPFHLTYNCQAGHNVHSNNSNPYPVDVSYIPPSFKLLLKLHGPVFGSLFIPPVITSSNACGQEQLVYGQVKSVPLFVNLSKLLAMPQRPGEEGQLSSILNSCEILTIDNLSSVELSKLMTVLELYNSREGSTLTLRINDNKSASRCNTSSKTKADNNVLSNNLHNLLNLLGANLIALDINESILLSILGDLKTFEKSLSCLKSSLKYLYIDLSQIITENLRIFIWSLPPFITLIFEQLNEIQSIRMDLISDHRAHQVMSARPDEDWKTNLNKAKECLTFFQEMRKSVDTSSILSWIQDLLTMLSSN